MWPPVPSCNTAWARGAGACPLRGLGQGRHQLPQAQLQLHRGAHATLFKVGSTSLVLEVRKLRLTQTTQPVDDFAREPCPMPGGKLTHLSSKQASEEVNSCMSKPCPPAPPRLTRCLPQAEIIKREQKCEATTGSRGRSACGPLTPSSSAFSTGSWAAALGASHDSTQRFDGVPGSKDAFGLQVSWVPLWGKQGREAAFQARSWVPPCPGRPHHADDATAHTGLR